MRLMYLTTNLKTMTTTNITYAYVLIPLTNWNHQQLSNYLTRYPMLVNAAKATFALKRNDKDIKGATGNLLVPYNPTKDSYTLLKVRSDIFKQSDFDIFHKKEIYTQEQFLTVVSKYWFIKNFQ